MEANELMIGNYLRVNHDGLCIKKGTIVEVRGIDTDDKLMEKGLIGSTHCRPLDDNQFEGGIWCEYLDPIPLTPETLEKNGWMWVERHSQWELIIDTIHIGWGFYKGCISASDWDNEGDVEITSLRCEFVHQLQQALRLCGIKKDIKF